MFLWFLIDAEFMAHLKNDSFDKGQFTYLFFDHKADRHCKKPNRAFENSREYMA